MKCHKCLGCPHFYNCEYCMLADEYVEDMKCCPDYRDIDYSDESEEWIIIDGEKVWVDDFNNYRKL